MTLSDLCLEVVWVTHVDHCVTFTIE